jgi:predicted HAD superfamily Cof-like phosphohydrolase
MVQPISPNFHRAVAAEIDRQHRLGNTPEHDDEHGLDHILELGFNYVAQGSTVKAGAMFIAARAYLQRHTKNPMQEAIEEFMRRCDQQVATYPQLPDEDVVTLRIRLMVEELLGKIQPPVEAIRDEDDNRYTRLLIQNKSDELIASMIAGDLVGIADGLADVLYVVIGTAVAYGIDIQEVFDEVHRSNLSKTVWSEELQRYTIEKDEFGKGIKPPTYSPASLEPIIQRQIENGKAWEDFYSDQANDTELVLGKIEG